MAQDLFQYEKMVEVALRGVVRDALKRVAREGLRSAHHFYIGFGTQMPGVVIPESLRARYPEEMTIVVQHQFWDLEVTEDRFSITLSFHKQPERLVIPFAAIRSFADPSVNFALEFAVAEGKPAAPGPASPGPASPGPASPGPTSPGPTSRGIVPVAIEAPPKPPEKPTGEVVTLDSFRKR